MIVPGRFDDREFDFTKSETQAELISVSLEMFCPSYSKYLGECIRNSKLGY